MYDDEVGSIDRNFPCSGDGWMVEVREVVEYDQVWGSDGDRKYLAYVMMKARSRWLRACLLKSSLSRLMTIFVRQGLPAPRTGDRTLLFLDILSSLSAKPEI